MTMLSNIVLFFLANISHCRLMRFYKWKNNQGAKVSNYFMCRGILSISCCRLIKKHSIMNISVLQNMVKSMHKWALILSTWCNHARCYWERSLWKLIDHVCNSVTRRQANNNVVEKNIRAHFDFIFRCLWDKLKYYSIA